MIDQKSIGQLIDELTIINIRSWFAQEKIMDKSLSVEERVKAAEDAQRFNSKRTKLVQAIDKRLGDDGMSVEGKSYA